MKYEIAHSKNDGVKHAEKQLKWGTFMEHFGSRWQGMRSSPRNFNSTSGAQMYRMTVCWRPSVANLINILRS